MQDTIWIIIGNIAAIITILGLLIGIVRFIWNKYHKSKNIISDQKISSSSRGRIELSEQILEGEGKQVISATKGSQVKYSRQVKIK